jgi:hypothetical protein
MNGPDSISRKTPNLETQELIKNKKESKFFFLHYVEVKKIRKSVNWFLFGMVKIWKKVKLIFNRGQA